MPVPVPSSARQGFTLLEVLAAVALIAIILTAVFRLHAQTVSMSAASRFYTSAPVLARKKLAELTVFEDESGESGDFGDRLPGWTWNISYGDVDSEVLGEALSERLKRVDLTITYQEDFVYSVQTYRLLEEAP